MQRYYTAHLENPVIFKYKFNNYKFNCNELYSTIDNNIINITSNSYNVFDFIIRNMNFFGMWYFKVVIQLCEIN